jgi:predicted hydrocarbon binding protein
MLYGKELAQSIQKRCRIQPGMLVKSSHADMIDKLALVIKLSPGYSIDRDYEGAEEHIFYKCQPLDGTPDFTDYVCNLEQVS